MKAAMQWICLALVAWMGLAAQLAGAQTAVCRKLTLTGQLNAGHEWRQPIGQGWLLRLVPLTAGYSGWDVVVDREPAAGYPDALLLATPPYGSINEREIGTTYGLRAQDAIGWNPRSFHFLLDPVAFHEAQKLYPLALASPRTPEGQRALKRLMELASRSASGQLHIDDARLNSGLADPKPFAQAWALRARRMAQTEVPAADGKPSAQGELQWMRFTVSLWLPDSWKLPAGAASSRVPCQ